MLTLLSYISQVKSEQLMSLIADALVSFYSNLYYSIIIYVTSQTDSEKKRGANIFEHPIHTFHRPFMKGVGIVKYHNQKFKLPTKFPSRSPYFNITLKSQFVFFDVLLKLHLPG